MEQRKDAAAAGKQKPKANELATTRKKALVRLGYKVFPFKVFGVSVKYIGNLVNCWAACQGLMIESFRKGFVKGRRPEQCLCNSSGFERESLCMLGPGAVSPNTRSGAGPEGKL